MMRALIAQTRRGVVLLAVAGLIGTALPAAQPAGQPVSDGAAKLAAIKWVNAPKPGALPTGVSHRTFFSNALGRDVGYCIYLPPGYEAETTVREFHAALLEAGVDHTYLEVEGLKHEHDKLVTMFRTTWFDYHAESFRRAGK